MAKGVWFLVRMSFYEGHEFTTVVGVESFLAEAWRSAVRVEDQLSSEVLIS